MTKYYFLPGALPSLTVGEKPEISFKEMKEMLKLNLTPKDLKKVFELFRPIDLYNIRAFWLGFPLDEKGNLNAKQLEEVLLVREDLPRYLEDFLDQYETIPDRLRNFASLSVSLYKEIDPTSPFLKRYSAFEREVRLVLTALRAKEKGRDIIYELQFEDLDDFFVADILAQKDAPEYTPPKEYEDLKTLFVENRKEPHTLSRRLLEYRFRKVEEMEELEHFSIDAILAYVARFLIVDTLASLDWEKGKIAMDELSQYE